MNKYLIIILLFTGLISCKHELEQPSWSTQWTAPVAYSSLDIHQLKKDSTIQYDTLEDSGLQLVYQQELFNLDLDSLVKIPTIGTTKNVKLDSISFADINIVYPTSLGEIITGLGAGLLLPNGSQAIIPPYQNVFQDVLPIDASDYFEQMILNDGMLSISLYNGLPTDIANVEMILRNTGSFSDILQVSIPLLQTGDTYQENVDLAGETLYGALEVEILNIDMLGTAPNLVNIDYDDALIATINISDIVPFQGTAIFPEQEIFYEDTVVAFDIEDAWLTEALVHNGGVTVLGSSTIQDTIKVNYSIPSATFQGQPFEIFIELPPAPVGGSITEEHFFDFSGYELDLTGKFGDTINTLYTISSGRIDSSGTLTNISLEDSIYFTLLVDVTPSIVKGYLGSDTISGTEQTEFNLFENFQGYFDLEQLTVKLTTENYIGASAIVDLKEIIASTGTEDLSLNGNALNEALFIDPATENLQSSTTPAYPSYSDFILNQNNSNIDELIELKPNQINIEYELQTNPDDNNEAGFLYKGFGLSTDMEISMPLSLIAQDIVLLDTTSLNVDFPDDLNETTFTILVKNGFPLSAKIKLQLLDENFQVLETLEENTFIEAAPLGQNGRVTQSVESQIVFPFNNANNLFDFAKNICFEVSFNSVPNTEFVNIYSDYKMELKLIANHTQNINQ